MHRFRRKNEIINFFKDIVYRIQHLLWANKPAYLTYLLRKDGAGMQGMRAFAVKVFAEQFGYTYVHSPFQTMAHNPEGISPEEWALMWDEFFNLGDGAVDRKSFESSHAVDVQMRKTSLWFRPRPHVLYRFVSGFSYQQVFPDVFQSYRSDLREKLDPHNRYPILKNDDFTIALHVRRGDVLTHEKYKIRLTDDELLLSMIQKIERVLLKNEIKARFLLFSEGSVEDFEIYRGFTTFPLELRLDECPFPSFKEMANSDLLICAKSAYSYLAALYSEAIVMGEWFWFPLLKDWIEFDENASFEEAKLERQIILKRQT